MGLIPKKKVLVCGATGFIGRNVAEFFASNHDYEVFGTYCDSRPFSHPGIKLLKADLIKKEDVEKVLEGKDVVIQAAATTSGIKEVFSKPYYHVTDNAVMNSLIFRQAVQGKVSQVIFFSCTVMYPSSDSPLKETDFDANREMLPKYFGPGWTKVYLEKMCEFFSKIGETRFMAIRHSNIYGPHDKFDLEKSHVFGATMTKVMSAKNGSEIVVWGTGEEERDLLYISDLVDFVDIVMRKQTSKFELVNVGLGKSICVKDLVRKIIGCSGRNIEMKFDASKPTIKTKLCLDITHAMEKFGWTPKITLDEGIKKTMQWYETNFKVKNGVLC